MGQTCCTCVCSCSCICTCVPVFDHSSAALAWVRLRWHWQLANWCLYTCRRRGRSDRCFHSASAITFEFDERVACRTAACVRLCHACSSPTQSASLGPPKKPPPPPIEPPNPPGHCLLLPKPTLCCHLRCYSRHYYGTSTRPMQDSLPQVSSAENDACSCQMAWSWVLTSKAHCFVTCCSIESEIGSVRSAIILNCPEISCIVPRYQARGIGRTSNARVIGLELLVPITGDIWTYQDTRIYFTRLGHQRKQWFCN